MKKKFFASLMAMFSIFLGSAQNKLDYSEFNISIGSLNYSGDIADESNVSNFFDQMGPNLKISAKRHFNDWFGMGVEMGYGYFTADDVSNSHSTRGFSVTTTLFQASAFAEVHFIRFGKYHIEDKFSPYIKFGGGFSAWDPRLKVSTVYPENLVIQNDAYSNVSFLAGLGGKFRLDENSVITLEWVKSFPGSDNLDGFIDQNQAKDNDTYYSFYLGYSQLIF